MKLDLKEGMYIRYIPTIGEYTQKISKITNIKNCMLDMCYILDNKEEVYSSHFDDIIKASDKLIDLICEGDYIDGMKVFRDDDFLYVQCIYGDGELYCESITKQSFIDNIKSIVTKEMFDQMSYKVGE